MLDLYSQFIHWLYANHSVGNGNTLLRLEEDPIEQERFLIDMGLPLNTEII
jgi:hypothetical protein